MENSATDPRPQPRQGTFHFLGLTIAVAIILSTLFTAWTPDGFLPSPPENQPTAPVVNPVAAGQQLTPAPTGGPTPTQRARPLIGIVVGHWGDNNDPGAVCDDGRFTELMANQTIANLVKENLTQAGLDVILLKEFDPQLVGFDASALVSIHADSCQFINDQATGFKVAAALANPRPERSARLTACLRSRYAAATNKPLHSTSITKDMTSYHAFDEISENTPAAIIETGFLNLDRELLEKTPEIAAQGISDGILCFIRNEDINPN